jgi:hypothetical protein
LAKSFWVDPSEIQRRADIDNQVELGAIDGSRRSVVATAGDQSDLAMNQAQTTEMIE